eukprot:scaffold107624_cov37-Prasinocladus_malaysianus.AAC.1
MGSWLPSSWVSGDAGDVMLVTVCSNEDDEGVSMPDEFNARQITCGRKRQCQIRQRDKVQIDRTAA